MELARQPIVQGVCHAARQVIEKLDRFNILNATEIFIDGARKQKIKEEIIRNLSSDLMSIISGRDVLYFIEKHSELFIEFFQDRKIVVSMQAAIEITLIENGALPEKTRSRLNTIFERKLSELVAKKHLTTAFTYEEIQKVASDSVELFCSNIGSRIISNVRFRDHFDLKAHLAAASFKANPKRVIDLIYIDIDDYEFERRQEKIFEVYPRAFEDFTEKSFVSIVSALVRLSSDVASKLYQRVRLRAASRESEISNADMQTKSVDEFELLKNSQHSVILGDAGAGKTAFAFSILKELIRNGVHNSRLIFYIEAYELQSPNAQEPDMAGEYIFSKLVKRLKFFTQDPNLDAETVEKLLRLQDFYLIVDGIDELENSKYFVDVTRKIESFVTDYTECRSIVLCRKSDYFSLDFNFHNIFYLDLFSDKQVRDFTKKIFHILEPSLRSKDNIGALQQTVARFISVTENFGDLRRTPIFLLQMCICFKIDGRVPENKRLLLNKCLDTIFDELPQRGTRSIFRRSFDTFELEHSLSFEQLRYLAKRIAYEFTFFETSDSVHVHKREYLNSDDVCRKASEHLSDGSPDAKSREKALYAMDILTTKAPILHKRSIIDEESLDTAKSLDDESTLGFNHSVIRDFCAFEHLIESRELTQRFMQYVDDEVRSGNVSEEIITFFEMYESRNPAYVERKTADLVAFCYNEDSVAHSKALLLCNLLQKKRQSGEIVSQIFGSMASFVFDSLKDLVEIRGGASKTMGKSEISGRLVVIIEEMSKVRPEYIDDGILAFYGKTVELCRRYQSHNLSNHSQNFYRRCQKYMGPDSDSFVKSWLEKFDSAEFVKDAFLRR